MRFFLNFEPPTSTAQLKKVRVVGRHPQFYEPPNVKDAKNRIIEQLIQFVPDSPIQGAIKLTCIWGYTSKNKRRWGEWRTTKPDTDNIQKMLKDCMTKLNYWNDDAQVVSEHIEKFWTYGNPGILIKVEQIEGKQKYIEEFANEND